MVSTDNGKGKEGLEKSENTKQPKGGQIPLQISSSRKILLTHENPQNGCQNSLPSSIVNKVGFFKFGSAAINLASPSAKFRRLAEDKDEISRAVPSSSCHRFRGRFNDVFGRKIDWASLRRICRDWIRDPMNMALFVWIACVAVSGAILFLVMTGMLNGVLPKKSQRNAWFEVNNQILNALFTLMCLYQHPKRCYHLVLLCRWRPEDVSKLRKIYCKNGTYKPNEWAHMMVVVLLLHVNCFAQYVLCGLNWGYKRSERPAVGVGICITLAIGAPAIAGVYSIVSPLGREYDSELDEEAQVHITSSDSTQPSQLRSRTLEKRFSFAARDDEQRIVENRPQWKGGVLDFWDDISLAYLSLFCSFCVFGWNMDRLGFGNMYVHIATFLLFCMAPFWIFNLAAVNIDNDGVREALSVTGIVLCGFGLLYGGFWRIQMRKRFNLPENNFCCGNPAVTDCSLWLCCCWCSLAQEVRTGNAYDVVEDKFCIKQMDSNKLLVVPLSHEDQSVESNSGPSSPLKMSSSPCKSISAYSESQSPSRVSKVIYGSDRLLPTVEEESGKRGMDETMTPPTPSLIQK